MQPAQGGTMLEEVECVYQTAGMISIILISF
jgi:hypothetical protein